MFSSEKLSNKDESLQMKTLRFLYKTMFHRMRSYCKNLEKRLWKFNRLRILCIEIYKSINNINPMYMNEIFKLRETNKVVRSNLNSI